MNLCQHTNSCLAFVLVLVVFIILSLAYIRGLFGQDKKSMSINVKWGRERLVPSVPPLRCLTLTVLIHSLQIPLPPPDTKLSVFRQSLSEHTRLPPNAFKLIYAGAVMKDDNAPRESSLPTKPKKKKTRHSRSFVPLHSGPRHVSPFSDPPIAFSFGRPTVVDPIRDMASCLTFVLTLPPHP
jgi:hypothetical protein